MTREERVPGRSTLSPLIDRISHWPWWMLVTIALGLYVILNILTNDITRDAFWFISGQDPEAISAGDLIREGLVMTIYVTFSAYLLSITIGLLMGLGRVSKNKIIYNFATFYVEIVRGIPMLVLLMSIAIVVVPAVIASFNDLGKWIVELTNGNFGAGLADLSSRTVVCLFGTNWCTEPFNNTNRVILGLAVAYGAFSAEVFRAGIESIERGQMEAARALGMTYFQAMRLVILPQAVRRILPALGNDFISMLKDSSLVSVLGVRDITQLNKLYTSSTFNFVQGYTVLAFFYLTMTILLTRGVRWMEARLSVGTRK